MDSSFIRYLRQVKKIPFEEYCSKEQVFSAVKGWQVTLSQFL